MFFHRISTYILALTRKFITASGHQLAYMEANPEAHTSIFFLHGNSGSADIWREQLADPRLNKFRLIALDLPGHGESTHDHKPEEVYNVIAMSKLVSAAIRELVHHHSIIVVGLSLGTNLIGEMLGNFFAPAGIVIISPTIVGENIAPSDLVMDGASATVLYDDHPDENLVNEYLEEVICRRDSELSRVILNDYHRVKPFFRSTLKASIPAKLYSDEVANLMSYSNPILCIVGGEDQITSPTLMNRTKLNFWNQKIFTVEKAGHLVCLDEPRVVADMIYKYSEEMIMKKAHVSPRT